MTTGTPDRRAARPLLCQLGRHAPERLPIWNDGYYFSRCRRCGADIVRPLDGGWQIPSGFRVVWQGGRPADEPTPLLKPEAPVRVAEPMEEPSEPAMVAAPPIAEADEDPPLKNDEAVETQATTEPVWARSEADEPVPSGPGEDVFPMAADPIEIEQAAKEQPTPMVPDEVPTPEPTMEEELPAPTSTRRSLIPDFMDDGAAARPIASGIRTDDRVPPPPASRLGDGVNAASLSSMFRRIADAREREQEAESGSVWRSRRFGAAAALAFVAGAFSVWALGLTDATRPAAPPAEYRIPASVTGGPQVASPAAGVAARRSAGTDDAADAERRATVIARADAGRVGAGDNKRVARTDAGGDRVVTASVLNCRKAPSTQASVKLKMVRGVPLTASRQSGEWSYVVRRGHQCWVQTKLIGPR